mmetsp:Transcript_138164/g.240342  ORF Transcript_138164/g.240342 Transcript_138164/m.240342 type:complete len:334 (-) Transcript_138164:27-1028(-)
MPLCVALKNSTAPTGLPPSPTSNAASQAAAKAGALSGKAAATSKEGLSAKAALSQALCVIESAETRQLRLERKLLNSMGHQMNSLRTTQPIISFQGPSGRVVPDKVRCREIGEHPGIKNPGPEAYTIEPQWLPCSVPVNWGSERRFRTGPLATNGKEMVKHSTHAHPFSPTYPYEEPQKVPPPVEKEEEEAGEEKSQDYRNLQPIKDPSEEHIRRNPNKYTDLNAQYYKYHNKPRWGFGSSGLGYRFLPNTKFSRRAPVRTTGRISTFEDRREEITISEVVAATEAAEKTAAAAAAKIQETSVAPAEQAAQDEAPDGAASTAAAPGAAASSSG